MNKLIITQDIVNLARDNGISMREAIEQNYIAEITDAKKANTKIADFDGLQMAMYSAGLSKQSKIKNFYEKETDNDLLFPTIIDTRLQELVSKQPMIELLVGSEQMIDGTSINALKLDLTTESNKKALNKRDVVEGSDLPVVKIMTAQKAISLFKRGVAVEATYESMRHTTLDMFTKTLDAISANVAIQQINDIIEVLVNGDGNNNALEIKTTTSKPEAVTKKDILKLVLDFYDRTGGMMLDTIICPQNLYFAINELVLNINERIAYNQGAMFEFPQAVFNNIRVIYDNNIPQQGGKDILIGINSTNAITKYIESGSIINEMATNIRNQTRLGTLSETVGFARFIDNAAIGLKFA